MVRDRRVVKRVIVLALPIVLWLAFVVIVLDWPHVMQEGNPIPIIPALIKLETTSAGIAAVPFNRKLQIGKPDSHHRALDGYMAERGWRFDDQMGSGLRYKRGDDEFWVYCRIYLHGRYTAYELEREP